MSHSEPTSTTFKRSTRVPSLQVSFLTSCDFKARSCRKRSITSLSPSVSPRPLDEAASNLQEWDQQDQDLPLSLYCSWSSSDLAENAPAHDVSGDLDFLLFASNIYQDYDFTATFDTEPHYDNHCSNTLNIHGGIVEDSLVSGLISDSWQPLGPISGISRMPNDHTYADGRLNSISPTSSAASIDRTQSSASFSLSANGLASGTHSPKKRPAEEPLNASSTSPSMASHSENAEQVNKRQRNTEAARRYRQRKVDRQTELEEALASMTKERDDLKLKLARSEAEADVLRGMVAKKS